MSKNKNPIDVDRDRRESEKFRAGVRAAHRPSNEAPPLPQEGGEPPFPTPQIETVLLMRAESDVEKDAKRDAARTWLCQFCARARFLLKLSDLRQASHVKPECSMQIDKVRHLLAADEIEAILRGA